MGCETCKIGTDQETQIYVDNIRDIPNNKPQFLTLLSSTDRQIWMDELTEPDQPEQNFIKAVNSTPHTCFIQIKKDIGRTFPGDQFFLVKNNNQRFENLLKKFALYFPKVGYTQGLNFIAGYLLIAGFEDDDAFKILVRLMLNDKLLLIGLYEDKFPLNRLYCAVFWKLLEKRQPNTAMKIKLANVPDEIWIFQWFMTFFLYSFPVTFIKRFVDYIVCKKEFAMVCLALGIINCLKVDINNMVNPDEFDFYELMDKFKNVEFCEERISIEKVINYANSITKLETCKALEEIKMSKDIYFTYFRRENERSQIWRDLNEKLKYERKLFQTDPRSSEYMRDLNSVEHLERLLLRKSRLYRSRTDSRFSSQIRTSNYTVDFDAQQDFMSERPVEIQENGNHGNKGKDSSGFFGLFGKYQEYGGILEAPGPYHSSKQNNLPLRNTNTTKNTENILSRAQTKDDSSVVSKESRNHNHRKR